MTACERPGQLRRRDRPLLGGTIARIRSIVWAAFELCTVAKTWWPVSAARRAMRIVSLSRTSPTRITSGSCRSACLSPCSNDGVSWPTSSCEIIAFWLVWMYSIGSSIVMILQRKALLIRSIMAARVVVLPLPVVPVTSVSPRSDSVMSRSTGGSFSSSIVRTLSWTTRMTIAGVPMWL